MCPQTHRTQTPLTQEQGGRTRGCGSTRRPVLPVHPRAAPREAGEGEGVGLRKRAVRRGCAGRVRPGEGAGSGGRGGPGERLQLSHWPTAPSPLPLPLFCIPAVQPFLVQGRHTECVQGSPRKLPPLREKLPALEEKLPALEESSSRPAPSGV